MNIHRCSLLLAQQVHVTKITSDEAMRVKLSRSHGGDLLSKFCLWPTCSSLAHVKISKAIFDLVVVVVGHSMLVFASGRFVKCHHVMVS